MVRKPKTKPRLTPPKGPFPTGPDNSTRVKPSEMKRRTKKNKGSGKGKQIALTPSGGPKKRKPRKPGMTQPGILNPALSKPTGFKVPKRRKPRPGTPTIGRTIKRPPALPKPTGFKVPKRRKPRPGTPTIGRTIKRPLPTRPMNRRKTR